jgi:hypothetical protein
VMYKVECGVYRVYACALGPGCVCICVHRPVHVRLKRISLLNRLLNVACVGVRLGARVREYMYSCHSRDAVHVCVTLLFPLSRVLVVPLTYATCVTANQSSRVERTPVSIS